MTPPRAETLTDLDMFRGYLDGQDPEAPEPGGNRSAAYRHGFLNARDDARGYARATAEVLRRQAAAIREAEALRGG